MLFLGFVRIFIWCAVGVGYLFHFLETKIMKPSFKIKNKFLIFTLVFPAFILFFHSLIGRMFFYIDITIPLIVSFVLFFIAMQETRFWIIVKVFFVFLFVWYMVFLLFLFA